VRARSLRNGAWHKRCPAQKRCPARAVWCPAPPGTCPAPKLTHDLYEGHPARAVWCLAPPGTCQAPRPRAPRPRGMKFPRSQSATGSVSIDANRAPRFDKSTASRPHRKHAGENSSMFAFCVRDAIFGHRAPSWISSDRAAWPPTRASACTRDGCVAVAKPPPRRDGDSPHSHASSTDRGGQRV